MTRRRPMPRSLFAIVATAALLLGTASANAAEITLYEHANFAGAQLTLRGWTPNVERTGFNDKASSIVVTSGRWEVCTDSDFRGTCVTFERGEYPGLDPRLNDRISSAREVGSNGDRHGSYNDYGRGAIELYDQRGFTGSMLKLDNDASSLRRNDFNDRAASVVVKQGTWELCADADFRGDCRTYAPGRYADLGYGMARQISSARLLRSAVDAPAVISPGGPPMPPPDAAGRAILYSDRGLHGRSLAVSGPVGDLDRSNFNDATLSLYVEAGTWTACRDSFFRGDCRVFGPGRYDDLGSLGFANAISSIRPGGQAAPPPPPPQGAAIEFFSEADFAGERLGIDRDVFDLEPMHFNDRTASVIVHAGTWELCTDSRFGGNCAVYRTGNYPRMGGLTRQVSSARRLQ